MSAAHGSPPSLPSSRSAYLGHGSAWLCHPSGVPGAACPPASHRLIVGSVGSAAAAVPREDVDAATAKAGDCGSEESGRPAC